MPQRAVSTVEAGTLAHGSTSASVSPHDGAPLDLQGEKTSGSEESPIETDGSVGEAEFKEGGYGWFVDCKTNIFPIYALSNVT